MKTKYLVMTTNQHAAVKSHLFPGDGLEAAAILICSQAGVTKQKFCVRNVILVPHDACAIRKKDRISWSGDYLERAFDVTENTVDSIVLIHSHPGGLFDFSKCDDDSDKDVIPCLFQGAESKADCHGSAIMTPDGKIKARMYDQNNRSSNVDLIYSVGHEVVNLSDKQSGTAMVFTENMAGDLSRLTACIVGVSGTGSIVAETLARLGVGKLILIDFDVVEHKNLNRILNSTIKDAEEKALKTLMFAKSIKTHHPNTEVITFSVPVNDYEAILHASDADVIFSCVDSVEGRHYCDLMCKAFLCPLIDLGVTIPTSSHASQIKIADVCGRIDYVHPDGPSLSDRKVVTPELLRREYLQKFAPNELEVQIKEGYIKGLHQEAPSVISINMRAAADGVNEWLSRIFLYRHESNTLYSRAIFSLAAMEVDYFSDEDFTKTISPLMGQGLSGPILGDPNIVEKVEGQGK